MVTNSAPAQKLDFRTASKQEIEAYFKSFATQKLDVYEALRTALTTKHPTRPTLPVTPKPIYKAPAQDMLPGWTFADVGGAMEGGQKAINVNSFDLYGGGEDIWARRDQFRFMHRRVMADFDMTVTLNSLADVNVYSKAGLMLRRSLEPDAACALISVFPSGEINAAIRSEAGAEMQGKETKKLGFPMRLRMTGEGSTIKLYWSKPGQDWTLLSTLDLPGSGGFAGAMALSHDNRQLVKVSYSDLNLRG